MYSIVNGRSLVKRIYIIRFNQQFYQAVNAADFTDRLLNIQQYMPEKEVPMLLEALQRAYEDRLNGSSTLLSFNKLDGSRVRFLIHFYFLNDDGETKRFYGSCRDVTEIAQLQQQMNLLSRFISKTVLFMTVKEDNYSFEVVAHGLEKEMGISREDMERELNSAQFYKRLIPKTESILWKIGFNSIESKEIASQVFHMLGADGQTLSIVVDADFVDDPISDVKCILSLRREKNKN